MTGERTLGSPLREICTMGSKRGDEHKRPRSLGEGTGSKEPDYSEAPQRATASRLVTAGPRAGGRLGHRAEHIVVGDYYQRRSPLRPCVVGIVFRGDRIVPSCNGFARFTRTSLPQRLRQTLSACRRTAPRTIVRSVHIGPAAAARTIAHSGRSGHRCDPPAGGNVPAKPSCIDP